MTAMLPPSAWRCSGRPKLLASAVAVLIAPILGCSSKVENYSNAYYSVAGEHYVVTLKGKRNRMAHDSISALLARTYEEVETIEVPRIDGVVEGREIPVPKGCYGYVGRIAFAGTEMKIDLYYDNYDDGKKEPLSWNGDYMLLPESNERGRGRKGQD